MVVGRGVDGRHRRGARADAAHLARPPRPRPHPRLDRAGRPAVRARLRDPAGRGRAPGRRGAAVRDGRRAAAAPDARRPDAGLRRTAGVARTGQPAAARLPQRLDRRRAAGRCGHGPALRGRRLQDQPARRARPAADRARLHPGSDDRRRCCTRTTRCRRCSTPWSPTATCAGACPATTPSVTSAASSTSTCAACADRRPRRSRHRSAACRAGCSAGGPPAALVVELSELLDGRLVAAP